MHEKLRIRVKPGGRYRLVAERVTSSRVATVCEEALCPNIGECWGSGTATFMIMGDVCTRHCRFCYVKSGRPEPLDPGEPMRVALAVKEMGLDYVTITSVDRDDLPDGGASHFAATVRAIKKLSPKAIVEVLIPDFHGVRDHIRTVVESGPEVVAHNIETVERLTPKVRDRRAGYRQSLTVLEYVKEVNPRVVTKSSILLGMGETLDEVEEAMRDLLSVGVDILVLSQYLRPSPRHHPLVKVYKKWEWEELANKARSLGFKAVVAGPLARTSYKAKEAYIEAVKGARAWS